MSLRNRLLNKVNKKDYTSLDTLYEIGKPQKQSTVEREMRDIVLETGKRPYWGYNIIPETDKTDQGREFIIGYNRVIAKQFDL